MEFIYKPNSQNIKKRKRHHDDTIIPTVVGDFTTSNLPSSFAPQSSANVHPTYDINQNTHHHYQQQNQHHESENDWSFLMSITLEDITLNNIEESDIEKYSMDWNNYLGLAIDAPKAINRDSIDSNLSILDKLKMIIKLFKEKYEDEKIHEMMMVLIKAAEDKDENLLIDVIQYGTMNDIKELVLILVKYKLFEVFKSKNEIDQNALHLAINLGYISLIKVLIKFGVDVNGTDAFGMLPIHLAVQRNSLAMVQELLMDTTKSVNMNEFDDNGCTPLYLAVLNNNLEIAKTLIDHGGSVLKKNPTNGFTCLHVALLNESVNKELIKLLIATDKTLLTLESHEGLNPLELSIKNKLPDDIIELISSFYDESKEQILDEKCLQELCEIFNKNDSWKIWLIRMDMADHIKEWVHLESPAKALFQYLIVSLYFYLELFLNIINFKLISKEYEENFT